MNVGLAIMPDESPQKYVPISEGEIGPRITNRDCREGVPYMIGRDVCPPEKRE